MIRKFSYSNFYKIIYRYGNIPATIILLFYLAVIILSFNNEAIKIIYLLFIPFLIFVLNRNYLINYNILPFIIEVDNDKLNCKNFFFSKKEVNIYFEDITNISGGFFDKRLTGTIKIYDSKNNCIAFYSKIKDYKILLTILMNKINSQLYNELAIKIGLKDNKTN